MCISSCTLYIFCLFPCICTECLLRCVSSNYFFPILWECCAIKMPMLRMCVSLGMFPATESKRTVGKKKCNYKIVCPKLKIRDPRAIIQIQELMRREGKTVPSSILMVCAHSGITQRDRTIDMIIFWLYLFRKHCIKAIYPPGLCFFIYQISSCGFFWLSTDTGVVLD